jgi:hypothetical protein
MFKNKIMKKFIYLVLAVLMLSSCDDIKDKVTQSPKIEQAIKTLAAVDSLKNYYTITSAKFRAQSNQAEVAMGSLKQKYNELKVKYRTRVNNSYDTWLVGDLTQMEDALQECKTGVNPYDQMKSDMDNLEMEYDNKQSEWVHSNELASDCDTRLSDLSKVSEYSDLIEFGNVQKENYDADVISVYKSLPKLSITKVDVLEKSDDGIYKLTITSNYKPINLLYNKKTDTVTKILK